MSEGKAAKAKPAAAESKAVKMWSPAGNTANGDTHIGLTSGHTFVIPHDRAGIAVPLRFRKAAIACGCLLVGMEPEDVQDQQNTQEQQIRAQFKVMMDGDEDGAFLGNGKPNLNVLSRLCGFRVERSLCDRLWDEFAAASDSDGDDSPND